MGWTPEDALLWREWMDTTEFSEKGAMRQCCGLEWWRLYPCKPCPLSPASQPRRPRQAVLGRVTWFLPGRSQIIEIHLSIITRA